MKSHSQGLSQLDLFLADNISRNEGIGEICRVLRVSQGPAWADHFGQELHSWLKTALPCPISTLSLFTGAGGLDIGFHDAGFDIREMIEIDERFVETLKLNCGSGRYFGNATPVCCDIRAYFPKFSSPIDFIIGGPPCQSFSAAGRRAEGVQGTQDIRGVLFEEYVRLLRLLKPKGFLFENVYGITGAEKGKAWEKIIEAFRQAGYNVFHRILDAADFGVPQHRERMFIVGLLEGSYCFPKPTHGPNSPDKRPYSTAKEAIEGAVVSEKEESMEVRGRYGNLLKEIPPGLNYSYFTEKMGHPEPIFAWRSKFSDFLYVADPNSPIRTLKAQGGQYTGPFHWKGRPFSIGELKRLQTFPDNYSLAGGRLVSIQQIGNSVPPQIARILALSILKQTFSVELPADLPLLNPNEKLDFNKRKRGLTVHYQNKARSAITEMPVNDNNHLQTPSSRCYRANIGKGFNWEENPNGTLFVRSTFSPRKWIFTVSSSENDRNNSFMIRIQQSPYRPWALENSEVWLIGSDFTQPIFTGLWKAFEHGLSCKNIKADLVQLSGYYQYKPSMACSVEFLSAPPTWEWHALKSVVEGTGIAEILTEDALADMYRIEKDHNMIIGFAKWLKSLGYEIRNHSTNKQIQRNCYLIPYAFPTLTPKSVQLNKKLEA